MKITSRSFLRPSIANAALALAGACSWKEFDQLEQANRAQTDAQELPTERADGGFEDGMDADVEPPDAGAGPDAAPPLDAGADAGADAEATGDGGCAPAPAGGRALILAGPPIELSRLQNPASVESRQLGPTAWLGAHRVWVLNSTIAAAGYGPPAGAPERFSSAALDGAERPWSEPDPVPRWQLSEPVSDAGLPLPFLTISPEEKAVPTGVNVTSVIRRQEGALGGLAFAQTHRGFSVPQEVWIADIEDGAAVAMRRPTPLFQPPDPPFALGAHRGTRYVTLFACGEQMQAQQTLFNCLVARVPVEQVHQRSAYEVRTQNASGAWGWSSDLNTGVPVIEGVDGDLSVSWNEHLGKFLAVHSMRLSNNIVLQTADEVGGPWARAAELALPAPPAWPVMRAREHPGLAQRCGRRLILSYWAPTALDEGSGLPLIGDVVLVAVDLQ